MGGSARRCRDAQPQLAAAGFAAAGFDDPPDDDPPDEDPADDDPPDDEPPVDAPPDAPPVDEPESLDVELDDDVDGTLAEDDDFVFRESLR